jgi:hypothetical protein
MKQRKHKMNFSLVFSIIFSGTFVTSQSTQLENIVLQPCDSTINYQHNTMDNNPSSNVSIHVLKKCMLCMIIFLLRLLIAKKLNDHRK